VSPSRRRPEAGWSFLFPCRFDLGSRSLVVPGRAPMPRSAGRRLTSQSCGTILWPLLAAPRESVGRARALMATAGFLEGEIRHGQGAPSASA
jgi:hypothetical protein